MEEILKNIPQFKIELDWEGSWGDMTGQFEEEFKDWTYSFDILAEAHRTITPATYSFPGASENIMESFEISNLQVCKNGKVYDGKNLIDSLVLEIENNVKIIN